jgi:hypothetical protein
MFFKIFFCWMIEGPGAGSVPRTIQRPQKQKHADPDSDPQHCFNCFSLPIFFHCYICITSCKVCEVQYGIARARLEKTRKEKNIETVFIFYLTVPTY